MSKVIDFDQRKDAHIQTRKDERTQALRQRFEAARDGAATQSPQHQSKAARRLLDLFKSPPKSKR
ncbi:MAG: hypothetical protein LBE21_07510 [Pseudomonadales bacterium]|jgi:hypothetical protein|nr:hypothetical protein [Pseudomonadales bacterium]